MALVASFFAFLRAHPIAAAATGATSGAATWVVTYGEHLALAFRLVAAAGGCLLTLLCVLFALPRFVRFCRRWRAKGFSKADGDEPPFLPGK